MVSGWSGPASWPCGRQRVGRAEATEGAGLQALSGFLLPPRERSQGQGTSLKLRVSCPCLRGVWKRWGCLLSQHCHDWLEHLPGPKL